MGRQKVKLQLVANESMRRTTFKKRKAGLLKKVSELSTLCGVIACAVIFGQHDEQAVAWPSPAEAARVLQDVKKLPAKRKKGKYMMDQEALLGQSVIKMRRELEKERMRNRGLEMELMTNVGCSNRNYLSLDHLRDMVDVLGERIETITNRIDKEN